MRVTGFTRSLSKTTATRSGLQTRAGTEITQDKILLEMKKIIKGRQGCRLLEMMAVLFAIVTRLLPVIFPYPPLHHHAMTWTCLNIWRIVFFLLESRRISQSWSRAQVVLNGAYINSDRNRSAVIKFNARTVLPNSWTKLVKQANIPQVADSCNRYFLLPFLVPCPSECSC